MATYSGDNLQQVPPGVYVCTFSRKNMARHIVCVLDRTVGHVSICWDYVSIFIYKNSNYNKINQITHLAMEIHFQTSDHVVAVEIVAEQHIGTKLCSCNTFEDISHLLIMVIIKVAITQLAMELQL